MNAVDTTLLAYMNDPRDPQKTDVARALVAGLEPGRSEKLNIDLVVDGQRLREGLSDRAARGLE